MNTGILELGDVLISDIKQDHFVVESIEGNIAKIRWLERVSGERVPFYQYAREVNVNTTRYEVIKSKDVDRARYKPPKKGWPTP